MKYTELVSISDLLRKILKFESKLYNNSDFAKRKKEAISKATKYVKKKTKKRSGYVRIPNTNFGIKFSGFSDQGVKSEFLKTKKARNRLKDVGIYVPEVYGLLKIGPNGTVAMVLEHINTSKTYISGDKLCYLEEVLDVLNINHGDLHMGNIIIERKTKEVVLIDWELAQF